MTKNRDLSHIWGKNMYFTYLEITQKSWSREGGGNYDLCFVPTKYGYHSNLGVAKSAPSPQEKKCPLPNNGLWVGP